MCFFSPSFFHLAWPGVNKPASRRIKKGKELEDKKILSKVSGFALPGELLAIMGPSGAGRLDALNLWTYGPTWEGDRRSQVAFIYIYI